MAAPKNIYKVWITSKEMFYSTNKKTSWTSEAWASNAAFDASRMYGAQNIEIHVFPVTSAEVIPYTEYIKSIREKREAAEKVKAEKELKKQVNYKKDLVKAAKAKIEELEKFIKENE